MFGTIFIGFLVVRIVSRTMWLHLFVFSFSDASCELCGFYFENRKALASHARAHLRQFGVTEWCVNGSPIETLSAWIRSRPQKAAEMQQSYAQGARYAQKKVWKQLEQFCDSLLPCPVIAILWCLAVKVWKACFLISIKMAVIFCRGAVLLSHHPVTLTLQLLFLKSPLWPNGHLSLCLKREQ